MSFEGASRAHLGVSALGGRLRRVRRAGGRACSMKRWGNEGAARARGCARLEGVIASASVQMAQYAIDDGRLGDDRDDSKLDLTSGTEHGVDFEDSPQEGVPMRPVGP